MEIGSEFWNVPQCEATTPFLDRNTQFVLSGRTALELVAQDLILERKIRSICLPAYCCDSMLAPFQRAGLELHFYDVIPAKNGIQRFLSEKHGFDAVLLLDYFGFSQPETAFLSEREHRHGTAVILDQVQSFYSETDAERYADYTVMSWRKWFFSCAAATKKNSGEWSVNPNKPAYERYVYLRKDAAKKKAAYLETGIGDKHSFLYGFSEAEGVLEKDFFDYAADQESVDALQHLNLRFLKQRRRENAEIIYEELNKLNDNLIRPLFPKLEENDTPLFVPVLVDPEVRAEMLQFMIHNQVYCPVHWPNPQTGGGEALYASELSLICDQRYNTADIEREMNLIKEFINNHA